MKIQFIIVGWHFDNFPELIEGLKQLNESNDMIDVLWTCHKEPSESVKNNFAYKVFPNEGLEDGAYQQALDYLNLADDTILFLTHDDIIIKSWEFINVCLSSIINYGICFIGNGANYGFYLDPNKPMRVPDYENPSSPELQNFLNTYPSQDDLEEGRGIRSEEHTSELQSH